MNKKLIYPAALVLVLVASFYVIKKINNHRVPQIDLPGIALEDLNGGPVELGNFAGKPLVVNFWGTWCGPCRQELPGFEKARQKYAERINILVISDEPVEKLTLFKEQNNYRFLYARSSKKFKDMGFTSVPVTYFYDADGKLSIKKKDPLTELEIDKYIQELTTK